MSPPTEITVHAVWRNEQFISLWEKWLAMDDAVQCARDADADDINAEGFIVRATFRTLR
jgi:hypothetical protein